jgi:hypothetical protein
MTASNWRPFDPCREECDRVERERERPRCTLTPAARARLDAVIAGYRDHEATS